MSATEVREEQPGDIQRVRELNLLAFGQPEEADIVDRLRHNCGDILSLVSLKENTVVGHLLFSPIVIEGDGEPVWGMALGPMAVLPEFQRQGIGSELMRTGISQMKKRGCPFLILIGHPEYYPRFGFLPARGLGIDCEWEVPDEAFMMLVLDKSAMKGVTGTAKYRPEFSGGM